MTTLAIAPHTLTKEGRDLERAGKALYDRVLLIDPHKTWTALEYDNGNDIASMVGLWVPHPLIFHNGEDITNIDALIVRGSRKYGGALSVLSRALDLAGCYVADPPKRFSAGYVSKVKTSISRYEMGVGSETYYAFYHDGANEMITRIRKANKLPVIVKPVDGKKSRGRVVVKTAKRLRKIAKEFFDNRKSESIPFYVQPFEIILNEYRVLLMDGKVVATVEKIKNSATARGSAFVVPRDAKDANIFARTYCSSVGVVGADVARTDHGFILIEENRAPQWRRLQEVTGIDIANEIVKRTLAKKSSKLDNSSS